MITAVYRSLYGDDFFEESVLSIAPHVDWITLVLAPRPWGSSRGIAWKGEWIEWPKRFDFLLEKAKKLQSSPLHPSLREPKIGLPKLGIVEDFFPTPFGQYDHIVDDVLKASVYGPHDIVFIEPDHVFEADEAARVFDRWKKSTAPVGATSQVEWWAPPGWKPEWRVPERRDRASVLFYRDVKGAPLPSYPPIEILGEVHNLGFCFSERTMRWKHLTGLAFASEIKDCAPNPDWFEEKWLKWHPENNNRDLEITLTLEHKIPKIVPCDPALLPESIRRRYWP